MPATETPSAPSQTTQTGQQPTESELAKRIDASGILTRPAPAQATQTQPKTTRTGAEPRTDVADDEIDDTDTDENQTDEDTDDGTDAAAGADEQEDEGTAPTSSSEVKALRKELAEIKALLAGKGKDAIATAGTGGAAAPTGPADKAAEAKDRLAIAREKIKAAKGTEDKPGEWKEIVEALGLEDLLDDVEAERKAKATEKQQAQEQAKQEREAQMVAEADQVHKALNNISRADPELTKVLGIGRHATLDEKFIKTRARIFAAATRALEDSQEEVQSKQRKAPITEGEALAIGIKRVTGKDVPVQGQSKADIQARERARMVRPASGGTTSKDEDREESPQKTERRLASSIDAFFRQGN